MKPWHVAVLVLIGTLGLVTTALALDTSSALYTSNIQVLNLGLTRQNFANATEISGSALIDDAFMNADTLNAVITQGPTEIPSMPPNTRIIAQDCVLDDGGSFSDWQTECQNATEADFALLPAVPAVDDAFYFACDNPCRIITVDVGQEVIASDLSMLWEYYNGTTFVSASNVTDLTDAFQNPGQHTVSFDMPTDFATTSVTGSAVGSTYWVRARVTAVSSPTQQALGNQAWYENGQWWQWGQSQSINQELLYQLNTGGADLVTNHQIFPGTVGMTTSDAASIELGSEYAIHFEGDINFTAGVSGSGVCIVCKAGALALYISNADTGEITLDVTGAGTTTLSLSGIPDAVDLPISTAPHTVDVISDGTDLTLSVDGVGSTTGTAQTVADTAADWSWGSNQGFVFANLIYILPDASSLAFSLFDTQAEWDSGTKSDTQSQGGQASFELNMMPDTGADDGYWLEGTSAFNNSGNGTSFGYQGSGGVTSTNTFTRFDNVPIAQGTTITAANLRFDPQTTRATTAVTASISAIDADDASSPTTYAGAEGATRTSASTTWGMVPTFTLGTYQDSPDISAVIQEIVDRPGWVEGNAIVIYIEDAGSTAAANTNRLSCAFEATCGNDGTPIKLQVTTADAPTTFSNDFIELQDFLADGDDIPGWNATCGGCREARATTDEAEHYGKYAMDLDEGPNIGNTAVISQVITGVNPGEVWSFGFGAAHTNTNDDTALLTIDFQDSGGGSLSSSTVTTSATTGWQTKTANGLTAPASTAQIELTFENTCDQAPFTCTSGGTDFWIDGVIACISPTAPTFPDSCNRVTNPSFENIYVDSGTWTSPTINLTQTDVDSSQIAWDAYSPFSATTTVETSLNGGAYQTATNGSAIPGITSGDDVSGDTLNVRVTFTPGTPTTLEEITFSPFMATLALVIIDGQVAANADLYYQLTTTPGVTIPDQSSNGNDATMSYPVQLSGIFNTISPMQSNRTPLSQSAALGVGDFASPITGSGSNLNLFSQDDGENIPFATPFVDLFGQVGFPVEALWSMAVMILVVSTGGVVWRFTSGNEFAASLAMAGIVVLASAIGSGLIYGWVPWVTIAMLVVYNVVRSRLPI